jgi:hypothetical protein
MFAWLTRLLAYLIYIHIKNLTRLFAHDFYLKLHKIILLLN